MALICTAKTPCAICSAVLSHLWQTKSSIFARLFEQWTKLDTASKSSNERDTRIVHLARPALRSYPKADG
jgi:hypothetical protein